MIFLTLLQVCNLVLRLGEQSGVTQHNLRLLLELFLQPGKVCHMPLILARNLLQEIVELLTVTLELGNGGVLVDAGLVERILDGNSKETESTKQPNQLNTKRPSKKAVGILQLSIGLTKLLLAFEQPGFRMFQFLTERAMVSMDLGSFRCRRRQLPFFLDDRCLELLHSFHCSAVTGHTHNGRMIR